MRLTLSATWAALALSACLGLVLVPTDLAAQAIDCTQARTQAEKLICKHLELRQQDSGMAKAYATVRAATSGALRTELVASQRQWLACRDRACTTVQSCARSLVARQEMLEALAARVSDSNPQLPDLRALALRGSWRAQAPPFADGAQGLPAAGTLMQFSPGNLCTRTCAAFGLEPGVMQPSDRLAAAAGAPAGTPLLTAIVDGKAAYTLLVLPGRKLAAVYNTCTADLRDCKPALQPWLASTPDARVVELLPQGEEALH